MTIVGVCRSCGEELGTPGKVWEHRRHCYMSKNPIVDLLKLYEPQTGIEREERSKVYVMEAK